MAKHRKTLKEKKIADLRHKFYSLDNVLKTSSSSFWGSRQSRATPESDLSDALPRDSGLTTLSKYPYLLHDISKTGILTGLILIAQIILFFLLKNHILVLPIVKY